MSPVTNIQPFQIAVSDGQLDDLKQRLKLTRLPDELDEAGWEYGAPLKDVKRLVARWQEGYDWRRAEAELNRMPQFTADVEVDGFGTLNIHFVHQKSAVKDAIPLFFSHGWPGHFAEVQKILPLLVAESPSHPSFHVVAFSLPGYGYSKGSTKKGFGPDQYAEIGHKLMLALGYEQYVTQGGDWGYLVTRTMATRYGGKHVRGWHTNMPVSGMPSALRNPYYFVAGFLSFLDARVRNGIQRTQWFQRWGSGYNQQQRTRPQTLGYALADSPAGLLAWIYEKLVEWTDDYPWTDDEVLDWVSIYWFSRDGPAASLRIYYECLGRGPEAFTSMPPIPNVATGASHFPKELAVLPPSWFRASAGNVVFEGVHSRGGHFAAHEVPDELVDDLRKMYGKGGPAFGVVEGKAGYSDESS